MPSVSQRVLTLVVAASALSASPTHADQVTLAPTKDNSIYSENDNSNGAGISIFAGTTNIGDTRRALLAFDVAGNIPAGSTITAVQLSLRMTKTISAAKPVSLHRALADWGEGTSNASGEEGTGAPPTTGSATWTHRFFDTELWTTAGGDFVAAASATQQVADMARYTWSSTPQLVADVQGWLDAPSTNFGWLVMGDESGPANAKRFASRENATVANRPQLVIDFTPPGSVPTATPTSTLAAATATATPTTAPPATGTATATAGGPTPSATATRPAGQCVGDCDDMGTVIINELILGVNIALGNTAVSACPAFDANGSGTVAINELIAAVSNALNGCP